MANARRGEGRPDATSDHHRGVLIILLAVCAALPLGWMVKLTLAPERLYSDFFGLWSAGRYVMRHAPATVYGGSLQNFQHRLGLPLGKAYPFAYPPWILLLLAPLGLLPYVCAQFVWLALTFSAYVVAVAPWRWPRLLIALLVLAPSSAICVLGGQNGFLTAALLIGGLRLLTRRPLWAGALLAAVAYKPQFAILLPFLLLAGRRGRALIGAGLSLIVLSAASLCLFGPSVWIAWLSSLRANAGAMVAGRGALLDLMPTPAAAAHLMGANAGVALAVQAAGLLIGGLTIWRIRASEEADRLVLAPLAILLAAPYAFDYDLPMVTAGVLTAIAVRISADPPFRGVELPVLIACLLSPIVLVSRVGVFAAVVPLVFVATLGVLWRGGAITPAQEQGR